MSGKNKGQLPNLSPDIVRWPVDILGLALTYTFC